MLNKYRFMEVNISPSGDVTRWRNLIGLTGFARASFHFYFIFSPRHAYEHARVEMREFSASRCRGSVYIFEQLVSRSFSTRALNFDTLCHSEPRYPSIPVVCYSDASNYASLMALTIDESMPAKFPRSSANTRSQGNFCRGNEASDFAEARNDFPSRSFRVSIYRVASQMVKLAFTKGAVIA